MTTADMRSIYWMQNKEWYKINHKKDCFELTEKAPEEAHVSFQMWLNGGIKNRKGR